jgi:hypothetical protein
LELGLALVELQLLIAVEAESVVGLGLFVAESVLAVLGSEGELLVLVAELEVELVAVAAVEELVVELAVVVVDQRWLRQRYEYYSAVDPDFAAGLFLVEQYYSSF